MRRTIDERVLQTSEETAVVAESLGRSAKCGEMRSGKLVSMRILKRRTSTSTSDGRMSSL